MSVWWWSLICTCGGGTWARPGQWGCVGSILPVASEFCWTRSYSCSLTGRIPAAQQDRMNELSKGWNQLRAEEFVVTVRVLVPWCKVLPAASRALRSSNTKKVIYWRQLLFLPRQIRAHQHPCFPEPQGETVRCDNLCSKSRGGIHEQVREAWLVVATFDSKLGAFQLCDKSTQRHCLICALRFRITFLLNESRPTFLCCWPIISTISRPA